MVFWTMGKLRERFGKPVFLGEIGMSHTPGSSDLTGRHLHTTNWASLTGGAAGGAMSWWWDGYIAPRELWWRYRGISAFVRGEQLDAGPGTLSLHGFETAEGISLEASALHLDDRILVWVRRKDATTVAFIARDLDSEITFPPLHDVALPLGSFSSGGGVAEFWDTETGEVISRVPFAAGAIGVAMPPFRTDIGVKLLIAKENSGK
jgi:hypothetical protein